MNLGCKLLPLLSLLVVSCSKSNAPTTSTDAASPQVSVQSVAESVVKERSGPGPLLLEPGKGLGVIRLGMTQDEVEALKLPTRTHPSGHHGPNVRRVGPYRVEFEDGKVDSVGINLRRNENGIRIGTVEFDESSSAQDVASALPGCKAPEQQGNGMMIECDEGRVVIRSLAACVGWDDAGVCSGYDPRRIGLMVQVRAKAK
jgi:hypothetical protein